MVKLSYHSPQFPPINCREAKANVSEFFYSPFFCSGFANRKMQDGKIRQRLDASKPTKWATAHGLPPVSRAG